MAASRSASSLQTTQQTFLSSIDPLGMKKEKNSCRLHAHDGSSFGEYHRNTGNLTSFCAKSIRPWRFGTPAGMNTIIAVAKSTKSGPGVLVSTVPIITLLFYASIRFWSGAARAFPVATKLLSAPRHYRLCNGREKCSRHRALQEGQGQAHRT